MDKLLFMGGKQRGEIDLEDISNVADLAPAPKASRLKDGDCLGRVRACQSAKQTLGEDFSPLAQKVSGEHGVYRSRKGGLGN